MAARGVPLAWAIPVNQAAQGSAGQALWRASLTCHGRKRLNHRWKGWALPAYALSPLQMSSGGVGWGMKKVFESTPALEESQA